MTEIKDRSSSVDDIGKYHRVRSDTVYRWIDKHAMPAHRMGRFWKFKGNEVDEWVKAGGVADRNEKDKDGIELFLLRNMSRCKGVGFFEACNFHPDFILWMLIGGKQYVTFIEPHGLLHEGPASEKVLFHKRIKAVEQRLKDPTVVLNSFILSWTRFPHVQWGKTQNEIEDMHVLFMTNDRDRYIDKLFAKLRGMVK